MMTEECKGNQVYLLRLSFRENLLNVWAKATGRNGLRKILPEPVVEPGVKVTVQMVLFNFLLQNRKNKSHVILK